MDRKLTFAFYGNDVSAGRTMRGIAGQTETLRSKVSHTAKAVGILAGGTAIAGLTSALHTGFGELSDYATGLSNLRAGLKSTHGASGTTVKGMEDLASKIQNYSGQTDDSIVATEQLLLTFKNIRNEAGKSNDIFDQTTKIAADMAQRLGGDASGAAIQLGKALNDPVKGITALTRVGVSFTDQQKKQIAAAAENGDTMKAQKIILKELNDEFGGSARQFGKTLPGQIQRTKRAYEDVTQELAKDLLPYARKFVKWVRKDAIPALEDFGGWVKDHKSELKWFAGIVGGLAVGFKAFKGVRSIQALLGRGPLATGGGLLGAASMARPIPVFVTNAGGIPGVGGGGVPTGTTTTTTSRAGKIARAVPVVGDIALAAGGAYHVTSSENAKTVEDFKRLAAEGGKSLADLKAKYLVLSDAAKGMSGIQKTVTDKVVAAMKTALDSVGALDVQAKATGKNIGTDLGQGLIQGIEAQIPHATTAGKLLVSLTAKQMRLAADAHSPSRVTMALGKDLADGLVKGYWDQKVWDKLGKDTRHGLKQLSSTLQDAMSYRSGVRSSLLSYASLSGMGSGAGSDLLGASGPAETSTRAYLRERVRRLREFRHLRNRLEDAGASPALLAEYDALGPDAIPEMRADLQTGHKGIHRLNRLERQAHHLAGGIARASADAQFGDDFNRLIQGLPDHIQRAIVRGLRHAHFSVSYDEGDRKGGHKVHHG